MKIIKNTATQFANEIINDITVDNRTWWGGSDHCSYGLYKKILGSEKDCYGCHRFCDTPFSKSIEKIVEKRTGKKVHVIITVCNWVNAEGLEPKDNYYEVQWDWHEMN